MNYRPDALSIFRLFSDRVCPGCTREGAGGRGEEGKGKGRRGGKIPQMNPGEAWNIQNFF